MWIAPIVAASLLLYVATSIWQDRRERKRRQARLANDILALAEASKRTQAVKSPITVNFCIWLQNNFDEIMEICGKEAEAAKTAKAAAKVATVADPMSSGKVNPLVECHNEDWGEQVVNDWRDYVARKSKDTS